MINEKGLDKGYEFVVKMYEVFGYFVINILIKLIEECVKICVSFM